MTKVLLLVPTLLVLLTGIGFANCGNGNGNGNGCSEEQGPAGLDGTNGTDGSDGLNGTDGQSGKDGNNGKDGRNADTRVMPVLDTALRIYDGKYIQLQAFNVLRLADHNKRALGGSTEFMAGARIVIKLGRSYEERLLETQQKEINALKQILLKK